MIRKMARQLIKWSKDLIIQTIIELNNSRIDLRDITTQRDNRKLYRASRRHFGSWRKALRKAGISYKELEQRIYSARREKEKEKLLVSLKKAYDSGAKLNRGSIINNPKYKILYWNSKKFYKGRTFWEDTLSAAGLNPKDIVIQQRWNKKKVREALLERKINNEPLNLGAISKEDSKLSHAICNHFDSHEDALRYAKINPNKVVFAKIYTNEELIKSIIFYHIKNKNLGSSSIRSKQDKKLKRVFWTASRRFDGWRNALRISGIDPSEYFQKEEWDKKKIKKEINKLYENDSSLHSSFMMKTYCPLYKAGLRYFGSWEQAIKSVGLDYNEISKQKQVLSLEEIITEIKKLAETGQALDYSSIIESGNIHAKRIFQRASSRFNYGWEEALAEAGFDYDEIRRKRRKYAFLELKEKVEEWNQKGKNLEVSLIRTDSKTSSIYRAVVRRFNSWYNFLNKIGIDTSQYKKAMDWKKGEGVLETLREMFPSGIMTGIRGKDNNLAAAICKYFKSVEIAAEKAELVYSRGGRISKELLERKPETLGILYKNNEQFVQDIVNQVYYGAIGRRIPTTDKDDLKQEASIIFINSLKEKPAKKDLREYMRPLIIKRLFEINRGYARKSRKEHLWGDHTYFDSVVGGIEDENLKQLKEKFPW